MEDFNYLRDVDFFENIDCFKIYNHVDSILILGKIKPDIKKVTIAIPTYKRPHLLKDALYSAINQEGYIDYDILIIDNEPEFDKVTETEQVVRSFNCDKIRYYRNMENIGLFGNWNRCFELSNSTWVTLLHDDDYYFPFYLKEMMEKIDNDSKIQCITSPGYPWWDDKTKPINESIDFRSEQFKKKGALITYTLLDSCFSNQINAAAVFLKKENVLLLGGYNPAFHPMSDFVFYVRYLETFRNTYILYKYLLIYRWLENVSLAPGVRFKSSICHFYLGLAISKKLKMNETQALYLHYRRIPEKYIPDIMQEANDFQLLGNKFKSINISQKVISYVIEKFAIINFNLKRYRSVFLKRFKLVKI